MLVGAVLSALKSGLTVAAFEGLVCSSIVAFVFYFIGALFWQSHIETLRAERERYKAHIINCVSNGVTPPFFSLYLRPFESTGKMTMKNPAAGHRVPSSTFTATHHELEQQLAIAFRKEAPLIALGQPGEYEGAARIPSTDEDWMDLVKLLMPAAMRLLVVPSHHKGTRDEVELIIANRFLNKTIFVMPPESDAAEWAKTAEALKVLGVMLPPYDKAGAVFRLLNPDFIAQIEPLHHLASKRLRKAIREVE